MDVVSDLCRSRSGGEEMSIKPWLTVQNLYSTERRLPERDFGGLDGLSRLFPSGALLARSPQSARKTLVNAARLSGSIERPPRRMAGNRDREELKVTARFPAAS